MIKLSKLLLLCSAVTVFSGLNMAVANEYSAIKKVSESNELEGLRDKYRECVLAKGTLYLKVNDVNSAIAHAPIACKRELLSVRQFLLSGAFKVEVVDQLMDSVREGVEIDLVNHVYAEVLKQKGIKP